MHGTGKPRKSQRATTQKTMDMRAAAFTQVVVDDTDGWDDLEEWIDTKLSNIPLSADVVG